MTESVENLLQTAYKLGLAGQKPQQTEDGIPFVLVPEECRVQDLEYLLPIPRRIRRKLDLREAGSFISYVNRFKSELASVIFAQITESGARFEAVLDYHLGATDPDWCQHIATYACPLTVEWQTWAKSNNARMDQTTFAEFIENNIRQIVDPPGAAMLEVSTTLTAKTTVDFVSGVRLQNGNSTLRFQETTDAKAGQKGEMSIPGTFTLLLPVFEGGEPVKVQARLRYRINDGKLHFQYQLIEPHLAVRAAGQKAMEQIAAETKLPVFMGSSGSER